MFFIATADARGQPDCSYKGGLPGFVRLLDDHTLAIPDYDGNGMYRTWGNVLVNPQVGLLFLDFEQPKRLRVNGNARIVDGDALCSEFRWLCIRRSCHCRIRIVPNCYSLRAQDCRSWSITAYAPRSGYVTANSCVRRRTKSFVIRCRCGIVPDEAAQWARDQQPYQSSLLAASCVRRLACCNWIAWVLSALQGLPAFGHWIRRGFQRRLLEGRHAEQRHSEDSGEESDKCAKDEHCDRHASSRCRRLVWNWYAKLPVVAAASVR